MRDKGIGVLGEGTEKQGGDRSRQQGLEWQMGQRTVGEKEEGERREEECWGAQGGGVGVQDQRQRHGPVLSKPSRSCPQLI